MIRKTILFTAAAAVLTFSYSIFTQDVSGNSSQAPAARTGAPGEINCTGCHFGPNATALPGIITSNIPQTGYVGGETYQVTVSITKAGISKFGFQITSMNAANEYVGTFMNNAEVAVQTSGRYASHNASSNSGTDSKSWTFDWVAPVASTGSVTFYASANFANNNGGTSGDEIVLDNTTVSENILTSNGQVTKGFNNLNVYPNPSAVGENMNLVFSESGILNAQIFDLNGKVVLTITDNTIAGTPYELNANSLSKGMYILQASVGAQNYEKQLVLY